MLSELITWLVSIIGSLGYPGIVILMGLESSFFPFPSEVVVIPAGYLASQGEMNLGLVIIAGTFGSVLGALFNYYLAVTLGRAVLLKHGRYFFIDEKKFAKVEKFLRDHGEFGTFIGRLIPVVRQYISFPAGLVRMNKARFTLFTAAGAMLWMTVLALIGYVLGENEDLVAQASQEAIFWMLVFVAVASIIYWKWKHMNR